MLLLFVNYGQNICEWWTNIFMHLWVWSLGIINGVCCVWILRCTSNHSCAIQNGKWAFHLQPGRPENRTRRTSAGNSDQSGLQNWQMADNLLLTRNAGMLDTPAPPSNRARLAPQKIHNDISFSRFSWLRVGWYIKKVNKVSNSSAIMQL